MRLKVIGVLVNVLLFYTLFILGATLIVACFSKRKAVFVFSGIFILFFSFFNYFSTTLSLFFYSLQNSMLTMHDLIFERLRMFAESGNSNLFCRVFSVLVSVVLIVLALEKLPFMIYQPVIGLQQYSITTTLLAPVRYRNYQHIHLIFSRFNC